MSELVRDWKAEKKDLEEAFDIIADKLVKADAEIEKLKAELEKYQRSNKDHWDHLADIANELRYDNEVREGHLDAIRDQRAEIEGLKARVEALRQIREEDKTLLTELVYWIESLWPSLSWGSDDSTMGRVRKLIQRGREATR